MTRVRFFMRDGKLCGAEFLGHSGYAEAGNDVVCAAVSMAVTVAESYLSEVRGHKVAADVRGGDEPRIVLRLASEDDAAKADCDGILRAVKAALEGVAEEYGTYLRVSVCEESAGTTNL
jgi:uncharacterized protein YsxB (DUF464 family)